MFNEEDGQGGFQKVKTEATAVKNDKDALGLLAEIRSCVNANAQAGQDVRADVEKTRQLMDALQEELAAQRANATAPVILAETERELKGFIAVRDMPIEKQGTVREGDAVLRGFFDKASHTWTPGLLDQSSHIEHPWVRSLRKAIGDLYIVCATKGRDPARYAPKTCKRIGLLMKTCPEVLRTAPVFQRLYKAFVDGSGEGAEWIIDMGIPDLIDDTNALFNGPVASLFAVKPMDAGTIILPAMTQTLRAYKYGATTSDDPADFTSSTLATEQRTFVAVGLAAMAKVDRDADEDAILRAAPEIRAQIVRVLGLSKDDAIINGDSDGTHLHTGLSGFSPKGIWGSSGLGGSDDHRNAWNGLIKQAQTNNSGSGAVDLSSSLTYAGFQSIMAEGTGGLGMPGSATAHILGRSVFFRIMRFDEYTTAEKVVNLGANEGGAGSINVFGFPSVVTDLMSDELTAAGIYDNSTKTHTGFLTVNTARFCMRRRLGVVVEQDVDIAKNQRRIVGRSREVFAAEATVASDDTSVDVVYGYGIPS